MSNSAINNFDFLHKKRKHNSILVKNDNTIGYRLFKETKEESPSIRLKHILSLLSEYFKLIKNKEYNFFYAFLLISLNKITYIEIS